MNRPAVLLLGKIDPALRELCRDLGFEVGRLAPPKAGGAPPAETALLLISHAWATANSSRLAGLQRQCPDAEMILVAAAPAIDAATSLARALDAEALFEPLSGRRTADGLRRSLERHQRRRRDREIVERLRALDPAAAAAVEELTQEARHTARALEEAQRLRSSFINNISHEVRTPVTVLQGMVELLADDLAPHLGEEQRDLVERIRGSAARVLAVVHGALALAKTEAGLQESRPTRIFFPDLVRDWRRVTEVALAGRAVGLEVDVPRGIEWLTVDGERLRDAVGQLLSNAAKFTARGTITLGARLVGGEERAASVDAAELLRAPGPRGNTLEIVVADTGEGIAAEHRDMVFEAFRQVDGSSTRRHDGLGIGLTLVRDACRLLAATVELESVPGQGTRFRLRLPVTAGAPQSVSAEAPEGTARSVPSGVGLTDAPAHALTELARLTVASSATAGEAVALALDALDRCLRPETSAYLRLEGGRGRIVEAIGGERSGLAAGTTPALPIERLRGERRAFLDTSELGRVRGIVAAAAPGEDVEDVLLVEAPGGRELAAGELAILQVVGGWLGLRLLVTRRAHDRGELVAALGRDVKNPLGALLGATQALLRGLVGALTAEQRATVLRVERDVHRAVLSTLDLLDQQRAVERGFEVEARSFALAEVVDHVLARHGAALELDGVALERRIAADLPRCRGDLIRTDRIVSTLLRALLEQLATPAHVEIAASAADTAVELRMSAHLRDAHPLLDGLAPHASVAPGEGLGLRLARRWVEAQEGRIRVSATDGAVTVTVTLPASTEG